MANKSKQTERPVSEEALLKALDEIEALAKADDDDDADSEESESESESDEAEKSEADEREDVNAMTKGAVPDQMRSTKTANGGFTQKDSDDSENFETDADQVDPSGGSRSMKSLVQENDVIRKGFEVSGFLEALTDSTVQSVDSLAKAIVSEQSERRAFEQRVQKAIAAMGNLLLEMKQSMSEQGEAPVVVRPRSALSKSDVLDRDIGGTPAGGDQFSREQVLDALTEMAVKGEIPAILVSTYEATGTLPPEFVRPVNQRLVGMRG